MPEPSVPERAVASAGANRVVFRHDLAAVALLAWLVLGAGVVVTAAPADRPALACGALALALAGLAAGVLPSLTADDDGVTLVNPWTTLRIGWAEVRDVTMSWTLTVTTDGAHTAVTSESDPAGGFDSLVTEPGLLRHHAWAVPGPRRMRSMWERHWTEQEGVFERDSLPALQKASARGEGLLGLGDAALIVAQRWAARGALTRPAPVVVTRSLAPRVVLVTAAALAAAGGVLAL
ncbi:MAG: hypothetical protein ACKVZ6_17255 [Kineosporiaceae bacterium]